MKKYFFFFVLVCFMLTGCQPDEQTAEQINYATLDTLQTSIGVNIGESPEFLPGQLRDLCVTSDGSILISDWANYSIAQFDKDGHYIATIAKKGNGPGEISQYFRMRLVGTDTLLADPFVGKKNYYARGNGGVFHFVRSKVNEKMAERPLTIIAPQSDTAYYAKVGKVISNFQMAVKNQKQYENADIALIKRGGKIIKDSLALIKHGNDYMSRANGGLQIESVPYQYDDQFVPGKNGSYMIARIDSSTFNFYNNRQQLQRSVSINIQSRPITDQEKNDLLKDKSKKTRSKIEARIADEKPPFLDVWMTGDYLWLKTTNGKEGQQMVVLNKEGKPLGKFSLPSNDSIKKISSNTIYTIHHGEKKGDTIRRYDVTL